MRVNVDPSPCVLSMEMVPPISLMIVFTVTSPIPRPFCLVVSGRSKRSLCLSLLMPEPLSDIFICRIESWIVFSTITVCSLNVLCAVLSSVQASIAFEIILESNW